MINAIKILENDLRILNIDKETEAYLQKRIDAAKKDIELEGIKLDMDNIEHVLIVVDYAAWLYKKRNQDIGFPRHLRYRMNNILFSQKGKK